MNISNLMPSGFRERGIDESSERNGNRYVKVENGYQCAMDAGCDHISGSIQNMKKHIKGRHLDQIPAFACRALQCRAISVQSNDLLAHIARLVKRDDPQHIAFYEENKFAIDNSKSRERRDFMLLSKCVAARVNGELVLWQQEADTNEKIQSGVSALERSPAANPNQEKERSVAQKPADGSLSKTIPSLRPQGIAIPSSGPPKEDSQARLKRGKGYIKENNIYKCAYPGCDQTWPDAKGIRKHIKDRHLTQITAFACGAADCSWVFARTTGLVNHIAGQVKSNDRDHSAFYQKNKVALDTPKSRERSQFLAESNCIAVKKNGRWVRLTSNEDGEGRLQEWKQDSLTNGKGYIKAGNIFRCVYPGCNKTWSHAKNIRRHIKT